MKLENHAVFEFLDGWKFLCEIGSGSPGWLSLERFVDVTWNLSTSPGICRRHLEFVDDTWNVLPSPGMCRRHWECHLEIWLSREFVDVTLIYSTLLGF